MAETKKQHKHIPPKQVFLHLLTIIALYFAAGSLVTVFYQYINIALPDTLYAEQYYSRPSQYFGPLRFAIASLVIVYPGFILSSWMLHKEYKKSASNKKLPLRKWLTYFTLFVGAIIIAGDLISIIYNFLQGELTLRFILKAISLLLIAGIIFGYYMWESKNDSLTTPLRIFVWTISIAILLTVLSGFFVIGSPSQQRLYKLDEQRLSDLMQIEATVNSMYSAKKKLPDTLEDIQANDPSLALPVDPMTGQAYEYSLVTPTTFKLCSQFAKESPKGSYVESPMGVSGLQNWYHPEGRYCFNRTVSTSSTTVTPTTP